MLGNYPIMSSVNPAITRAWYLAQIVAMVEIYGLKEKPSNFVLNELANRMQERCKRYKVSEVMALFSWLRAGHVKFFGALDIATIMNGVNTWVVNFRNPIEEDIRREEEKLKEKEHSARAMSREEYEEYKRQKNERNK